MTSLLSSEVSPLVLAMSSPSLSGIAAAVLFPLTLLLSGYQSRESYWNDTLDQPSYCYAKVLFASSRDPMGIVTVGWCGEELSVQWGKDMLHRRYLSPGHPLDSDVTLLASAPP